MCNSYSTLATSGRVVPDSASVAHATSNALLTATANVTALACDVSLSACCLDSGDCVSGEFTQIIIPVASHIRNVTVAINNSGSPRAENYSTGLAGHQMSIPICPTIQEPIPVICQNIVVAVRVGICNRAPGHGRH